MRIEIHDNERITFLEPIDIHKLACSFPTWILMFDDNSIFISPKISMFNAIERLQQYLEKELVIQPHR